MKKNRIGILTFHRSINYGAVTQCYALVERIKKEFPSVDVEVIDYMLRFRDKAYNPTIYNLLFRQVSSQISFKQNLKNITASFLSLLENPQRYKVEKTRFKAIRDSLSILPLSPYYEYDDWNQLRLAIKGKYDIIITGSDCVWKWGTVPFPNAYYLPGDFGAVKMSYAASFAMDNYMMLSDSLQNDIAKAIRDFNYVGLRDVAGEYNVKNLSPDVTFYHNCDPTLLIDRDIFPECRKKVLALLRKKGVNTSKPFVGIMANDIVGKMAREIFGDKVTYIGIYNPCKYVDYSLSELSVLEWAASFGLFSITFTTFFHGTLLSLINETPVLTFDYYGSKIKEQPSKLYDLYSRLKLMDFYNEGKREYTKDDLDTISKKAKELVANPPKEIIRTAIMTESHNFDSFREALNSILTQISE